MSKTRASSVTYVERVYSNVSQEVVQITTDKINLILKDHFSRIETNSSWKTPLAIFFTILLTLCTTNTREFLGVAAEVWRAIFIIAAFLSFVWFICSAWRAHKSPTIEEIIAEMKKEPL